MTAGEFLTNVAMLSTMMGMAAVIEVAVPMFAHTSRSTRRAANLGLTSVVFLLNWSLSSMAAILALAISLHRSDPATRFGLPMAVQIAAGVILLDFSAGYLSHRLMC